MRINKTTKKGTEMVDMMEIGQEMKGWVTLVKMKSRFMKRGILGKVAVI